MKHPPKFLLCALLAILPAFVFADPAVIDECRYPDNATARSTWQPMGSTALAAAAKVAGRDAVRLPCNFAGTSIERASWDRKVTLDLAGCRGIQFDVFCPDAAPVSHFSIYFQSGDGWYSAAFHPEAANTWQTVAINKTSAHAEGKPSGWSHITAIRISAWRGGNEDTALCLSNLRKTGVVGVDASVAIIRAESVGNKQPDESRAVDQFAGEIAAGFESFGIECAAISDLDVTAAQLRAAKLVVLPHNSSMPDSAAAAIVDYLNAGGKLLSFYSLPSKLSAAVKIETGKYVKTENSGRFSAIKFADGALPGAPPVVGQHSWNITQAKPADGTGRVLAEWLDDKGQPVGEPAIIATPNCIHMTHVLLTDDLANKRRMLLAMAGFLTPDLWRQGVAGSVAKIGLVGGCKNFDEAAALITKQAGENKAAKTALAEARALRDDALKLEKDGEFGDAINKAAAATRRTTEAFCMAQQPLKGEFRAFWCHNAFGVPGMDWDEAIKRLADAGFTAILPNMLWGGVAFYDSKTLPVAPDVAEKGDQIAQCLAACRKYGVQIHVWKVNWNTGHQVSKEFLEKMRTEGRLQVSSKGKEEPWLCPSHPENQKLEITSMVEVARDYDVDGIHFDYIRYPDGDHCFCPGCRERFTKAMGSEIKNWPADTFRDGPLRQQWLDWRRGNITAVVKATSEQARALKPKIRISAAVFSNWATDRDGIGQDWKLWCDRGWLDFVCPMDYTESDRQFNGWIARQKQWAGKVPVYPGIGVSTSRSRLMADHTISQIGITRSHHTGGFTIFNYGVSECRELLPMLGLGITSKR